MNKRTLTAAMLTLQVTTFLPRAIATESHLVNYYPSCEYSVLTRVKKNDDVKVINGFAQPDSVTRKFDQMSARILRIAEEKGAQYVALTKRTIKVDSDVKGSLIVEAELFNVAECDEGYGKGKLTPYNASGKSQVRLDLGTTSISYTFTIHFDTDEPLPELPDDRTVSLAAGLYGVALGSELVAVKSAFGTPNFEVGVSDDFTVLGYGRHHWLYFSDAKLVRATYGDDPFSNELLNKLPFDARFDDRQWQVADFTKGGTIDSSIQNYKALASEGGNELVMYSESFRSGRKVAGFTLGKDSEALNAAMQSRLSEQTLLPELHTRLQTLELGESIDINKLDAAAVAQSRGEDNSYTFLFDRHTLVKTNGSSVSKVFVGDVVSQADSNSRWRYGDYFQGQTFDEALKLAGEDAFYLNGRIEVNGANHDMRLFFEQRDDKELLYAMEISVY